MNVFPAARITSAISRNGGRSTYSSRSGSVYLWRRGNESSELAVACKCRVDRCRYTVVAFRSL
jgi:hypothetical protein